MPAHSITSYNSNNLKLRPNRYSCDNLINFIKLEGFKHPIINRIKEHYDHLTYFMDNHHRFQSCKVHKWLLSVHFRGNEILTNGNFYGFGCGMRGVEELGIFNINSKENTDMFIQKVNDLNLINLFSNPLTVPFVCQNVCFVDWVVFDFILSGFISLDQAKNWFVFFNIHKSNRL